MDSRESVVRPDRFEITSAARASGDSADGRVLLHVDTGRICAINGIGSQIWTLLEAGYDVGRIVESLATRYDASPDAVERDLRVFVQQLAARGFVRPKAE